MGTLIHFPGMDNASAWTLPIIYTPARIDQLARSNATARRLRTLGYRIINEDAWPDDDGAPIIQIDVSEVGDRSIRHLAEGLTFNADHNHYRTTVGGVRVCWQGGKA